MNQRELYLSHDDIREQFQKIQEDRIKKASEKEHLIHGFMIYVCKHCHAVYIMHLEAGLEDKNVSEENHKPVPFTITCPDCFDVATHVLWSIGRSSSYVTLENGKNFFMNDDESDCGVPIIFNKDFEYLDIDTLNRIHAYHIYLNYELKDFIPDIPDLMVAESIVPSILSEFKNRTMRRHGSLDWADGRYKRPRKGDKPYLK